MQSYWVIQSTRSHLYFEQDVMGWSWASEEYAYHFQSEADAVAMCHCLEVPLDYVRKIG